MLTKLEKRNQQLWEGHPRTLEDLTHVLGGIGIGLLFYSAVQAYSRSLGFSLILAAALTHLYADQVKPKRVKLKNRMWDSLRIAN